jgi:serine/threonine protein kinase
MIEREILQNDFPFLVSMYFAFQSPTRVYFVLEYISGELFSHFLQMPGSRFSEDQARFYAAETVRYRYAHRTSAPPM